MESNVAVELLGSAFLFLMTLGMGMAMVSDDIRRILVYPKAVAIGAINQMLILPLVGLGLVLAFEVEPVIAVGLLLLTFCPGGVGSNVSTLLARGDAALSVTLTFISSCLIVVTLPLLTNASMEFFMGQTLTQKLPLGDTVFRVIGMILVPIALGMSIRRRWPRFTLRAEHYVKLSGFVLMSILITGIVIKDFQLILTYAERAGGIAFALCGITMALGFCSARLFGLNRSQGITIAIEVGTQNSTLAIVIASILNNSQLAIPALIYTVANSLALVLIIGWANLPRQRRALEQERALRAELAQTAGTARGVAAERLESGRLEAAD